MPKKKLNKRQEELFTKIPEDKLMFFNGSILNKHTYEITHLQLVPFNRDLIEGLSEDALWEELVAIGVEWLKVEGKLPSTSDPSDWKQNGVGYANMVAINNIKNLATEEEEEEYSEIELDGTAFDRIILPDGFKGRVSETVAQLKHGDKIFTDWGLGEKVRKGRGVNILLTGPSGTGKTYLGEVISEYLGMEAEIVSVATIESKWMGESEQNIQQVFSRLNKKGAQVLILDEADSWLESRSTTQNIFQSKLTNQFLIELERHNGVCVMTTNRPVKLDKALSRRIDLVLEIPRPGKKAREAIWKFMIPKKMPSKKIDEAKLSVHALTGGQIKNVVLAAARKMAFHGHGKLTMELLNECIAEEMKESSALNDNAKDFS